jgi:hypothetical protein
MDRAHFSKWLSFSYLASMVTWPNPTSIFFLWGYIKERVYVPPIPCDLPQLRQRIVEAVATINGQMLQLVWQELDYRFDICCVTRGGHIEHLWGTTETLSVSPSVNKLPFGVTIAATVLQRSEILEGLMDYPVLRTKHLTLLITIIILQMRIYSNVVCRSQNCFSENEHF